MASGFSPGRQLGVEICGILGINEDKCIEITINVKPEKLVVAVVSFMFDEGQAKRLTEIMRAVSWERTSVHAEDLPRPDVGCPHCDVTIPHLHPDAAKNPRVVGGLVSAVEVLEIAKDIMDPPGGSR